MANNCLMDVRFPLGVIKILKLDRGSSSMTLTVLNDTLKWLILCYVKLTSIK